MTSLDQMVSANGSARFAAFTFSHTIMHTKRQACRLECDRAEYVEDACARRSLCRSIRSRHCHWLALSVRVRRWPHTVGTECLHKRKAFGRVLEWAWANVIVVGSNYYHISLWVLAGAWAEFAAILAQSRTRRQPWRLPETLLPGALSARGWLQGVLRSRVVTSPSMLHADHAQDLKYFRAKTKTWEHRHKHYSAMVTVTGFRTSLQARSKALNSNNNILSAICSAFPRVHSFKDFCKVKLNLKEKKFL